MTSPANIKAWHCAYFAALTKLQGAQTPARLTLGPGPVQAGRSFISLDREAQATRRRVFVVIVTSTPARPSISMSMSTLNLPNLPRTRSLILG